ncbi:hypothetical protein SAPIO_CDS6451 [Scedosporium apiospermum]|uniref:HNH nuclease domain-containing protein n=1 Tax=Pseudallescheria apiosperma TaxID=563466 RepID=A0A084G3X8_PSEDA|nr:uncharacterized protein SAPIO_CDS6451 [Scedosporium apiospermum]KEZ42040.1 hypothetical protein SAPIO_CDS6451 [Scedosporium apiospermum]
MSYEDPFHAIVSISPHPSPGPGEDVGVMPTARHPDLAQTRSEAILVLQHYTPLNRHDDTALLLRTFLNNLPDDGKLALALDVLSVAGEDNKLRQLRNFLVDAILKPMQIAGGKTPRVYVSAPTNPNAPDEIEEAMTEIESSPRNDQQKLKTDCLRRDGFRCVISGLYDRQSIRDHLVTPPAGNPSGGTECAHILPFALRKFNERNAQQTENAATIWWGLHRYFPSLRNKIDAGSINQPQNAMTLAVQVHDDFGSYDVALSPIQGPDNKYHIQLFELSTTFPPSYAQRPMVTLTSRNTSIPVPDPVYLDTHARIARILEAFRESGTLHLGLVDIQGQRTAASS